MIFLIYRTHNAGVEGSSPSLSINQISYFRLPLVSKRALLVAPDCPSLTRPIPPVILSLLSATQAAEFAVGAFGASLLPFH